MTGETLLGCPFCGSTDLYNAFPKSAAECGVIACRNCGAEGPDAGPPDRHIAAWQSRALGPALDRVIAEVEGRLTALWKDVNSQPHTPSTTHRTIERLEIMATELQVLRAEQSADAGGERGGGS